MKLRFANKKLFFIIPIVIIFLVIFSFLLWKFFIKNNVLDNDILNRYKNEFSLSKESLKYEPFSLIPNKISEGGYISVTIPSGFTKDDIKNNLKFSPEIKGEFIELKDDKKVGFKPSIDLKVGQVFAASITSIDNSSISADFVVAEKPKILNIFPNEGSEIDPKSNITIIFNRPIVPLSIVDVMDDVNLPITISPKTEGKFKWISTNTLQFIPNNNELVSSSNYKVQINNGFNSTDGVKIEGIIRTFKTKVLRYDSIISNKSVVVYNDPFSIKFNQDFDLEKTKKEIILKDKNNKNVDFIAEYGFNNKVVDKTVLVIYNKQDKYNRNKFWDFDSNYYLKLNKAYPALGGIVLDKSYETNIVTTKAYSNIYALSDRSNLVRNNVFDPKGKLVVNFYEDIDLSKTIFSSDKIKDKTYAKKCQDEELIMPNCDQEDNKKTIYLTFDESKIKLGESFDVNLESIINTAGLKINNENIYIPVKAFDVLKIISTFPKNEDKNSDLNTFAICSNNPLAPILAEDVKKQFKSNVEFEPTYLQNSYYIDENADKTYVKCNIGEYETRLSSPGFSPETDYIIDLKVSDSFDQSADYSTSFTTTKVNEKTLNFFHYQGDYNVTTKDKTNLTFAGYNIDYVDVNACKVTAEDMLYYLTNKPDYKNDNSTLKCLSSVNKRVDLPKKYWTKNYFKVDLKDYFNEDYGHYIFSFSNPLYKDEKSKKVYERSYLTVTNLNVVEKKISPSEDLEVGFIDIKNNNLKNLYFVTKISDLSVVANADIDSYILENLTKDKNAKATNIKKVSSIKTESDGVAHVESVYKPAGAIVKFGNDSAVITSSESGLGYSGSAYNAQVVYLYSDRPIYKPGDVVDFKGMYRVGYDGNYQVFKEKKIPVKIYDSNNNEIYSKELDVNDFGTFSDKIILSSGASVGTYRIESKNYNSYNFDVQEYVPAAFKIDSKANKNEFIAGEDFNIKLDASYYFGAPLENAKVDYTITSTDYYFDKYSGDEYYNFTNSSGNYYYRDYFAYRGSADLINGKAEINGKLDFVKFFKEGNRGSKIFNVYMNVINSTGNSITAVQSFIVHAGKYYIGINTDKYFLGKGENFNLKLKTVDTIGNKISINNINLKLNKVTWIYNKRKEVDGSYYYNWEKKYDLVKEITVNTNSNGDYSSNFNLKDEGEYNAIATYKDENGNNISSATDLYVYGSGDVSVRPTNDNSLDITAEKTDLNSGDKAKIIIKSPYKTAKAFISIERGRVYSYEIIDINQNIYEYSFDLKKEYAPNVYVSVVLMSSKPELKYGNLSFQVNSDDKKLNIDLKTNKESYLPGEKVIVDVYVKDNNGKSASTELSMAVVDMSVLALKGNPKKDPISFFYNYFPLNVATSSNLKNILNEVDVANRTKGGSGAESGDLAKKKRGEFRDTAFWNSVINTDVNGYAHLEFKMPDNLTTWQIETIGITKDTKFGVNYKEFVSKKELMLTPLKPRFAILGDEFLVGAKLFNQTGSDQIVDIAFDSGYLEFRDSNKNLKIEIKNGENKNIYFKVYVPLTLNIIDTNFSVSASNSKYKDSFVDNIKIKTNDVFEVTATSGYSKNDIKEYIYLPENISKSKGELTINTSGTLLPYINSAIKYISETNDSSTEGIASKLKTILSLNKLNSLKITDSISELKHNNISYKTNELIPVLLSDLYKNYRRDNGFGYYSNSYYSDYYLNLYTFDVLTSLKDNGINISDDIYKNLQSVVLNNINNDAGLYADKNTVIITTYLLSNSLKYNSINIDSLVSITKGYLSNNKFLELDSSNFALIYLADLASSNKSFESKNIDNIYKILENRTEFDSRGAYLKSTNAILRLYENSISDTALFVDKLSSLKKNFVSYDKLLRWINSSKNKDGYWNNEADTQKVINAFISYIDFKKESIKNFSADVLVNNKKVIEKTIPISKLTKSLNSIAINNNNKNSSLYYDVALKYYVPANQIGKKDEGFVINRGFYKLDDKNFENKVSNAKVGEVLKGRIDVVVSKDRNYVNIDSYIPAGFELVNFALSTENQGNYVDNNNQYQDYYIAPDKQDLYPDYQELRDDKLFLFKQYLNPGVYKFDYYLRALIPGKYSLLPSYIYEKYTPENFGRTEGNEFVVNQ